MQGSADLRKNRLLAALPPDVLERWQRHLEWVNMPLGQVLYAPGTTMGHAYFPIDAIAAIMYVTESGASAQIAVVGNEGMVGISLFMGGGGTPSRGVVQSAGRGVRIISARLQAEFERGGPVMHLLLRYTQALITQMAQTVVCNRHHTLDRQLCRWLLLSLVRVAGADLVMTHERMAHMLGVRREGVSEAALHLKSAGLIDYRRGHITVLDRAGLERRTCECYQVVKTEYDRLLPAVTAT